MVVTEKMFRYCSGCRTVSLFVDRSTMFVKTVFKSAFSLSDVLFVTAVALYHVNDVFRVAVNVLFNKSSFAGGMKSITVKSVRNVVAR